MAETLATKVLGRRVPAAGTVVYDVLVASEATDYRYVALGEYPDPTIAALAAQAWVGAGGPKPDDEEAARGEDEEPQRG